MSEVGEQFRQSLKYAELSSDVARVRARLALGYEEGIEGRLVAYMEAIRVYERTREGMSYSVIEVPKIYLADALLQALGFPTAPDRSAFIESQRREPKDNQRRPIPSDIRWRVWERDNFTCLKCGIRRELTIDHKIAVVNGGTDDIDNLQTLCGPCNSSKGAR